MATPEAKFKQTIMRRLLSIKEKAAGRLYYKSNAGSAYGGATGLDIEGICAGKPFVAEVKRPDGKGKLTLRQQFTMDEVEDAGGVVFLIDTVEDREQFLSWVVNTLAKDVNPDV